MEVRYYLFYYVLLVVVINISYNWKRKKSRWIKRQKTEEKKAKKEKNVDLQMKENSIKNLHYCAVIHKQPHPNDDITLLLQPWWHR